MKLGRKMKFLTFTKTYSRMPLGCLMDQSTRSNDIVVNFTSPSLSLLCTDKGIKLTYAPKPYKAFLKLHCPMVQGMESFQGFFTLGDSFF